MSVYDYAVFDQAGNKISLDLYRGKLLLIVNTATVCGFTPQYTDLERIYNQYKDRGFEILDFPCNQFNGQAPGSDEEIHNFCTLQYGTTFPQFHKIDVNGENADPLYDYLTSTISFQGFGYTNSLKVLPMKVMYKKHDPNYEHNGKIKWNFTKYLIDRTGIPIRRFEPIEEITSVERAIIQSL